MQNKTKNTKPELHAREVKSYVRRQGHFSERHKNALSNYWCFYGLDQMNHLYHFDEVFGRQAPVIFEIGFGMGDALINFAQQHPDYNVIGVEVHQPGIGNVLAYIHEQTISNVRVFNADAIDVLKHNVPDNCLDAIHIFFPDPWPKRRHHKRRLIQPAFLDIVLPKLKTDGIIHVATDWQNYAEWIMDVLSKQDSIVNCAGPHQFSQRPETRSLTKYEQRGLNLGYSVWDIMFKKK